jgi:hypothetical protein
MMRAITPGAVLLGLLVSSPSVYAALTDPAASVNTALLRFVLGVLGASVGLSLLRGLMSGYARSAGPQRRATDAPRGDQPPSG